MKIFVFLTVLFLLGANICCAQDTLKVKKIQISLTSGYFTKTTESNSSFVFPKFYGSSIAKKIDNGLLNYLNSLGIELQAKTIRAALDSLKWKKEWPGIVNSYYKIFYSENTISLRIWFGYGGGAHPSHSNNFLTFSTLTGNRLNLDSLIKSDKRTEFYKILKLKKSST